MKQLNLLDSHKEETIKEFIEKAMLNAKREALQKNTWMRSKTWHVTDFVKACLRNTAYSKRPELKRGLTDELVNVLYQGQIVHENSKLGSINELSMCYDIINKIAIDPQDVKELPEEIANSEIKAPAIIIIGEVVNHYSKLSEFLDYFWKSANSCSLSSIFSGELNVSSRHCSGFGIRAAGIFSQRR